MTCRRCKRRFDTNRGGICPHCGVAQAREVSGVMKTSTILISAGATDGVYRNVKEIPPPLRKQLLKSTSGLNAATILIADRRGRHELAKAIRNLPGSLQQKLLPSILGTPGDGSENARWWRMQQVAAVVLVFLVLLLLIVLFNRS